MSTAVLEKQPLAVKSDTASEQPRRICFVCTGNTCRSPMAQAVAGHLIGQYELPIEVMSAGLYADDGAPISSHAVTALEKAGIVPDSKRDFHDHTAHTLTLEEAERADLLVGMGSGHVMELMMRYPALASRITCLCPAVSDPWGGDLARYEHCLFEIRTGVQALLGVEENA